MENFVKIMDKEDNDFKYLKEDGKCFVIYGEQERWKLYKLVL